MLELLLATIINLVQNSAVEQLGLLSLHRIWKLNLKEEIFIWLI
jgi:hypothetical protein